MLLVICRCFEPNPAFHTYVIRPFEPDTLSNAKPLLFRTCGSIPEHRTILKLALTKQHPRVHFRRNKPPHDPSPQAPSHTWHPRELHPHHLLESSSEARRIMYYVVQTLSSI